jgi:hypothetical protein
VAEVAEQIVGIAVIRNEMVNCEMAVSFLACDFLYHELAHRLV